MYVFLLDYVIIDRLFRMRLDIRVGNNSLKCMQKKKCFMFLAFYSYLTPHFSSGTFIYETIYIGSGLQDTKQKFCTPFYCKRVRFG